MDLGAGMALVALLTPVVALLERAHRRAGRRLSDRDSCDADARRAAADLRALA